MTEPNASDGLTASGSAVTTDVGPFSIVPEWVLDAEISDRAKVLYAILGRYADKRGRSFPRRKILAERLRCSVASLDRARDELEAIGALDVKHRYDNSGQPISNLYTLRMVQPGASRVTRGTPTGDETGTPTGDAQNENHLEREPRTVKTRARPAKVDRLAVTSDEAQLSAQVLAAWNAHAGQSLTAQGWLAKIIMRIREHPELGPYDHAALIERTLANPWWKGAANPNVLYGNDRVFEAAMVASTNGDSAKALMQDMAEMEDRYLRRRK